MKTKTVNTKTQTLSFFVLCSIISFCGAILYLINKGIPGSSAQIDEYFPYMLMILLSGPLLSALLLKVLYDGVHDLGETFKNIIRFKFAFKWYFFALLFTPLVVSILLGLLSLYTHQYLPEILNAENKSEILIQGLIIGIFGGLVEELGWTGFLIPKLLQNNKIFITGLSVGLFWGIWHIPMTYWASGDMNGALSMDLFLPPLIFYLTVLPVFRIFMVWLYSRTSSLLLSILTHASLIFSTLFVLKPVATGYLLIVYYILLSLVLWTFVFIIQKTKQWKSKYGIVKR
jgi:membrane protease YdiL (CAAX protease family)